MQFANRQTIKFAPGISRDQNFEKAIRDAITGLPPHVQNKIKDIEIHIDKRPSIKYQTGRGTRYGGFLLGSYEGIPKRGWGSMPRKELPQKINLFQEPIQNIAKEPSEVKQLIKKVISQETLRYFTFNPREKTSFHKRTKSQNNEIQNKKF